MGWYLAPALDQLRSQVNAVAPERSRRSDGTVGDAAHRQRRSDHNPDQRGAVRAIDLTDDPLGGFSARDLAEALRQHRDGRLKYVIWFGRMFASYETPHRRAWQWGKYSGYNQHKHHVHVSVVGTPHIYSNRKEWHIMGAYLEDARGHTIKEVQRALTRLGLYEGPLDGKRNPSYRTAVRRFNGQHGELQQDGDLLSERGLQILTLRRANR